MTNAQNIFKRYHKCKTFIIIMLEIKKSRFRIQNKNFRKKNRVQTVRERLVEQTSIEQWKHDTDYDKMKKNNYDFHLI